MFGVPVPQPALNQEQPYMNPKQGRAYIDGCRNTVFDILRTANLGQPAFGWGGGKRGKDLGPNWPQLPPPSPWQDILTDFYGIVLRYLTEHLHQILDHRHLLQDCEQGLRSGGWNPEQREGGGGRLLPLPDHLRHLRPLR